MGTESHLINIEILDNHEEATIGAFLICDLCAMVGTTINRGVSVYLVTNLIPIRLLD